MISSQRFYGEYHGHRVDDLEKLLPVLRQSSEALIWTAGDSSLDNKYWLRDRYPAPLGYPLDPPQSVPDVTYWLNILTRERNLPYAAINTAVEATTVNERTMRLRPQDIFLRDNLRPEDTLIVSVGGNDVAMAPCPCTILTMLSLVYCFPESCLSSAVSCGTVPLDDCCCGCGPSLCSCACSYPPCFGYFRHLFGTRVQYYIEALTAKTKPARVLVCTIYYPDERNSRGWASPALGALGYNHNPQKLQSLIRQSFYYATSNIRIAGTTVVPVPLFHVLNGKNSQDYVERVEPSTTGGKKMAEFLLDCLQDAGPTVTRMDERE